MDPQTKAVSFLLSLVGPGLWQTREEVEGFGAFLGLGLPFPH